MKTQMKRCLQLISALMLVCIVVLALGACDCGGPVEPTPTPTPHSITVKEGIEHGTVSVDKSSAIKGETVKVTATPDENYILVGITANDTPVENGEFVMGDADVVVSASFALNSEKFETNAGVEGGTLLTAPSMGGGEATAQIFTVFGDNGVEFTAYVTDAGLSANDGVAILFSKALPIINQLLPDGKTVKVAIYTDGKTVIQKTDAEGKLVDAELAGTSISVKLWTKDGTATTGYIVRATVGYEALGVEKDSAKGAVTICPVVYNAYGSVAAKATALNGADENAHNTYPVLSDDNTYTDNPFKENSAQLGSAGNIIAGNTWDLSKDYYVADTENYPNRVALLTGHDGADNNLVFRAVSANEMYAEAVIKVTGIGNPNDQWPKFGMMLFNGGTQNGVFFYVDSAMNGPSGNTTENIVGTAVGYNKGVNEWKQWTFLKDGVFDLTDLTIKLGMVFQDGWVHMYADDVLVGSVFAGEYNEDMHFGFKSFGLNLEVTEYFASDDAEADGWADKKVAPADRAKIDTLFAGDSYMDFWKSRYQNVHLAGLIDTYANEGIGGTQVPLWIEKVGEMQMLYDPSNIVFHIGVNDIDGGSPAADTIANLKTMFEAYHEAFPNAKLYWNNLIPNTMFADKVTIYYEVNAAIKAYAEDKAWLTYIDQVPSFEKSAGVANPIYFDDGLHLSPDIGYPLWVKNMLAAMGKTRSESSVAGDVDGYAQSGGWTYRENGEIYLDKANELVTYFKGADGEMVYVEALVTIGQLYNNDGFPKFGFVAHGDNKSFWGLIDSFGYPTQENKVGAFVSRTINNTGSGDFYTGWNWDTWVGGLSISGSYANGEYVKLAMAKYNNTLYLLANGKVLATVPVEGSVQIGFQVFNLETTLKDVVVTKNEKEIKNKLGMPESAVVDGKADDDIWTEEVLANTITMGSKGDGRRFEVAAVKTPEGIYFLVTTYSFENTRPLSNNWWENANVEFRFGDDTRDSAQFFFYYTGPGFNSVASSGGISAVATSGAVQEGGLYKATAEFLAPYGSFAGYTAESPEIPVHLWGWVFDEGWYSGMNVGGYPKLTVSEHGLRYERQITVNDANAPITVSGTTGRLGDTVTVTVNDGATIDQFSVMTAGSLTVETVKNGNTYTFTMPDEDVVIYTSEVKKTAVEVIFAGDSYMDFWKSRYQNVHLEDYIDTYINEGIGGTMVPLWIEKAGGLGSLYTAEKIVFHIGVNDIDGGATAAATIENLKTMFEAYHRAFPTATIYWNSLIPNTMFPDKIPAYYEVNAAVKAHAEANSWLVYIDQTPSFEKSAGVANPMYFDDGLHLSIDIGYPLWVKNMLVAMGYERIDGTVLGDVDGFAHSGGWNFNEDGTVTLDKWNEMIAYFKGANGENVYVEAYISVGDLYNNDAWPKFGLLAHGEEQSLWGFIDAAAYPTNVWTYGALVPRAVGNNNGILYYSAWNWNAQHAGTTFTGDNYANGSYVKLALGKHGDTVYLLANDQILSTAKLSGEVQLGIQVFSLELTIKDIFVANDEATVKEKLGIIDPEDATIDGSADDAIWTEEVLANTHSFGDKGDGRHFEVAAVKGSDGIYFLVTTYSNENTRQPSNDWWVNANIEFRFGDDLGRQHYIYYVGPGFGKVESSAGIIAVATDGGELLANGLYKTTAEFFVPYKTIDGYDVNSDEIPVRAWGWVFDEGWKDGMSVGEWPTFSVSEKGLRFHYAITEKGENSAVNIITSKNEAAAGDKISVTINTAAEVESLTAVTASGMEITLSKRFGVYSFIMPSEEVIITVKLKGISVSSQVEHGSVDCDLAIVVPSQVVDFTVTPDATYKITGVKVNGESLALTADGRYSYTVKGSDTGVDIVVTTDYDTEGYAIDGVKDEAYGDEISFLVEGDREVSIWAIKGANGIYFYVQAITNTVINDNATEWWMNHNFEFQLNMSGQRYLNSRNETYGTTRSIWKSTQITEGEFNGKWQHVAEIFVHRDTISNFDGDVQLNYAFKAPHEVARFEGLSDNRWDRTDWWTPNIGTLDGNAVHGYNMPGVSPWLKIRANGLVNTKPAPQHATIDADLSEYTGKLDLYAGNEKAYFHIMGFEGSDGVYLAFEIWQKNLAASTPEWHLNDNIEIQIDGVACGFSIFDNFIAPIGSVNSWAMKRVESDREGYAYKTVVELFVSLENAAENSFVWIGCNGNGFGGWQSLFWDGNIAFASNNGISTPAGWAMADGVTLDGKKNESFYADKSTVKFTPNGATVVMNGVKLENGAVFAFEITHTRPVTDNLQGVEDWWSYLNFEIYLGLGSPQVKASVWNNYAYWCAQAFTTTDNGNGTYTTVMEVYIPYGMSAGKSVSGDIQLGLGMVIDGGYVWGAEWVNNLFLTADGVIFK